jgi:hypothetical protein
MKVYTILVAVISALSSIGMMIGALYLSLRFLLGTSMTQTDKQSLSTMLPYGLLSLALWISHLKMWQTAREKTENKTDEVVASVVVEKEAEVK